MWPKDTNITAYYLWHNATNILLRASSEEDGDIYRILKKKSPQKRFIFKNAMNMCLNISFYFDKHGFNSWLVWPHNIGRWLRGGWWRHCCQQWDGVGCFSVSVRLMERRIWQINEAFFCRMWTTQRKKKKPPQNRADWNSSTDNSNKIYREGWYSEVRQDSMLGWWFIWFSHEEKDKKTQATWLWT